MAESTEEKWSYTAGDRPNTVTVYERGGVGGVIYARAWNPAKGSWTRKSLKHRDKKRAETYAEDQAKRLARATPTSDEGA